MECFISGQKQNTHTQCAYFFGGKKCNDAVKQVEKMELSIESNIQTGSPITAAWDIGVKMLDAFALHMNVLTNYKNRFIFN